MKTTVILDTSVLIFDPHCIKTFKNTDIIIPIQVLEELDKLKTFNGETGKKARVAIRYLDELTKTGEIHLGIKLQYKSTVKIILEDIAIGSDKDYNDNKILGCALFIKERNPTLLSKDINLRIKCRALGISSEDYVKIGDKTEEFYTGMTDVCDDEMIQEFMEKGEASTKGKKLELYPNQCITFKDSEGNIAGYGRKQENNIIKTVKRHEPWGISPRNAEQSFALDLIFDPNIPLVSLMGGAGVGKTLIALAAGLELVLARKKYNKLIIYRPIQAVGADIGYLPGTKLEKIMTWMGPILDNFETLMDGEAGSKTSQKKKPWMEDLEMYIEKGSIEFDALTYIRGRSINNALILVDEAQNLSEQDAKTILTRVGNSKIIMTGDIDQIDAKDLDASRNAISLIAETFKESKLAGHISLKTCQRSELASEAIKLFS